MTLLLLACASAPPAPAALTRPPEVPVGAHHVRFVEESIQVDGKARMSWKELSDDTGPVPELDGVFDAQGAWMSVPSTAAWHDVQRLLASAMPEGPVYLGDLAFPEVVGPYRKHSVGTVIASCPAGPIEVVRAHPRLSLEVHSDDANAWVTASVRFLPVVLQDGREVVANLLPDECWAPKPCASLGASASACTDAAEVVDIVPVAGEYGCLLSLGKGFQGHTAWRTEVPEVLEHLGFGKDADVLVTATEVVPYGGVWSVLAGVQAAGIEPHLGLLRMGSGSGAPLCEVPTRSAAAVAAAGEAWYGQRQARVLQLATEAAE